MLRYLRENLPESEESVISGFVEANRRRHEVSPDLDPRGRLVPVDDERFGRIFAGPDGWERFREDFPDSDGTLRISRIGFDRSRTQALFYAGQQFDWTVGSSGFWLLVRSSTGWTELGRAGDSL